VLGAQGYVDAGHELLQQAPDLDTAVVAVGSGGTMAGLVHALGANRVFGVDCGALSDAATTVTRLIEGLSSGGRLPKLRLRLDQVGRGYSQLSAQVEDAILLAARTEGIVLDPIYTGRALAGLVAAVRDHDIRPGRRTVLLHTGGMPGLFGHRQLMVWAQKQLVEQDWSGA
jgi:L-cysteate sulfo-lyase